MWPMFKHGLKPVIGLIGGIGAGKTTAARCFAARGGVVIDADALGHEALRQPAIIAQVVERWGTGVRKPDGSLDRRAIGRIVFANAAERNALESIVFPYIGQRCREGIERGQADPQARFIVLDAAVMLEAGWNNEVDRIVYVSAPRDVRLARLARRSGWIDADLTAREAAQWPEDVKQSRVGAVILNDADADTLRSRVDDLLKEWGLLAPQSPPNDASEKHRS
jgi:dephospho-CoA kinase